MPIKFASREITIEFDVPEVRHSLLKLLSRVFLAVFWNRENLLPKQRRFTPMTITAVVVSVLLVCAAFGHFVIAFYFRTKVMLQAEPAVPQNDFGLASIVLSVRGCDPGLKRALIQLLQQDYENYEVHLVVDHRSDSAWEVVHQVQRAYDEHCRLTIHEMTKPLKTCGLKCSSLLQGFGNIHPNSKYLVLIDSDVTPHASWLSQLIAPLSDKKIGVVTGNQWFEPDASNAGSLLRSLWNAGALVPTAIYSNPWAGTFAMRMRDVRRARLTKIWRKSIVDDGPIRQALKPLGLNIHFCPSLIMINREKCTFGFVHRYVTRMLTWSKMYEPTFLNTLIHCVGTVGLLLAAFLTMIFALAIGAWTAAAVIAGGLATTSLLNTMSYYVVRNAVSNNANLDQPLPDVRLSRALHLAVLAPVACLIYGYSCLQATLQQKIQWRQITYELRGNSRVKMLGYRPWVANETEPTASEVSL